MLFVRLLAVSVILFTASGASVETVAPPAEESTDQIVARMMELDRVIAPKLRTYTSVRHYVLENKRFGKKAQMTVQLTFQYPGLKKLEVIAEEGSATIRKRVFRKMLDTEMEASKDDLRAATKITPANYSFRLIGSETLDGRKAFLLETTPKVKNQYLFQGKIWVDAEDYAIVHIEGMPAQNPSFWIRKTSFVHRYGKFGPFWLALSNTSSTDSLVFGRTDIRIDYSDYRINQEADGISARTHVDGK